MILAGAQVVLGFDGRATARLAPGAAHAAWRVGRITVQTTAGRPTVRLYWESETPAAFIDGTVTGNADVGEYTPPLEVFPGQAVLAVWEEGVGGSTGSITFDGQAVPLLSHGVS